jgi:hypothetical protein
MHAVMLIAALQLQTQNILTEASDGDKINRSPNNTLRNS